ncbi:MAG: carboxypeptidase-like regulatory domain-containing protein, partial [Planctomycetota bacterium]
GTLEVTVRWSDGAPAAALGVLATIERGRAGVVRRTQVRTDALGVATFHGLAPASYALSTLWTRHEGSARVATSVEAGEIARATIVIAEGLSIEGVVRDMEGDVVPDAEIWLAGGRGGWASGGAVATADQQGRFTVRDVPEGVSLGALAEGFMPGPLADLDLVDTSVPPVQVELLLTRAGGAFAGRVLDGDGDPVAGAVIIGGERIGEARHRFDDTTSEAWPRRYTTSEEDGSFRLEAVPPGAAPVFVRAAGFAQWRGTVDIAPGSQSHLDVILESGAVVRGRVTDAAGAAIEYARVHAFTEPLREDFLQTGQVDFEGPFAQEVAVSRADGSYELSHLPRRKVFLYAMEPRREGGAYGEVVQFTRSTLDLEEKGPHTWDPVLSDGRTIEGLVRYKDGTPIKLVFVSASATDGDDPHRRAMNTPDGSFKFIQLPGRSYAIRAQIWDLPEGHEEPQVTGVLPGGGPVELVATFNAPEVHPTSKVVVRFEDAADRAQGGRVSVSLERLDRWSWHFGDRGDDGAWTFTHDEPAEFRPVAQLGERVIAVGEPFEFVPGTDYDLGTLRSEPGGTLILNWTLPEGFDPGEVSAYLSFDAVRRNERVTVDPRGTSRFESLQPGGGKITLLAENALKHVAPYEIVAGEISSVDIALTPAVGVPYHIDLPSPEQATSVAIRFVDAVTDTEISALETEDLRRYPNPIDFEQKLVAGTYRLEVVLGDGTRKATTFRVPSLDPAKVPKVTLDVR